MQRRYFLGAMACALFVSSVGAQGATKHLVRYYKPTLLINPADQLSFHASALNNRGEVVGSAIRDDDFNFHAAIWRPGQVTFLQPDLPNTWDSEAVAVNDRGDILAGDQVTGVGSRAVIWHQGTGTDIGTPVGSTTFAPAGMNNRGQVIGYDKGWQAYVWSAGTFTPLPVTPESRGTYVTHINNVGHVTGEQYIDDPAPGTRALLWRDGSVEVLEPLPGMTSSDAAALNDFDHVVGTCNTMNAEQAFFWRDGQMTAMPPVIAGDSTTATSINRWDQVTGAEYVAGAASGASFPVLWEHGRAIRLSDLIRPQDKATMDPNIVLSSAFAINDWGQMLVWAVPANPDVLEYYIYLFTPVYEWQ